MVTNLTYNCNPDSLGDIEPTAFVDAFENEIRANPKLRDCAVVVTLHAGQSGLESITETDDEQEQGDPFERFQEITHEAAQRAFRHCCESADTECAYCGVMVPADDAVPAADDDAEWERLTELHAAGCEWCATRAHRREPASAKSANPLDVPGPG